MENPPVGHMQPAGLWLDGIDITCHVVIISGDMNFFQAL